jgi:transposase
MFRHELTDAQWQKIEPIIKRTRQGPPSKLGDRMFVNAVLYRARTGIAWRDLPERFGTWNTVYNRFCGWSKRGEWARVFKALRVNVDSSAIILDASIVRAHQDAAGGKGGSKIMRLGARAAASQQNSTPSSICKVSQSTLRSHRATATK